MSVCWNARTVAIFLSPCMSTERLPEALMERRQTKDNMLGARAVRIQAASSLVVVPLHFLTTTTGGKRSPFF